MDHKTETPIISGVGQKPAERVETSTCPRATPVSPQLIHTVQEMPIAAFLYDPSAPYAIASSKKAHANFGTPKNVLDVFADSEPKAQLKMSETSGHNLDDLDVPLQGGQGYATISLRHDTDHATHTILLYLVALSTTADVEFDVSRLTPRERDIVELLRAGNNNEQIANSTGLTAGTVYNHISRILEKFGMSTRAQIVAKLRK